MADDNFSSLFDLLPIGAYRSTPDGHMLRGNAALVRLNGYNSEAELLAGVNNISTEWYEEPGRRDEFMRLIHSQGYVSNFISAIFRHKTREPIWVREHAHVVRDATGAVLYYEGTVEDISEQRAASTRVEASERRFRALTEKAQLLTVVCDADGRVQYASNAANAVFGCSAEQLTGRNLFSFVHPDEAAESLEQRQSVLAGTNSGTENVRRFLMPDGSTRHIAGVANNALADPAVGGIVVHLRDVTDAYRADERLRQLATTDALTNLRNRSAFEADAEQLLSDVGRGERSAALYFIDLDRFKLVNDSLGHAVGDELLRIIAQRLATNAPPGAVVGRLGGDEFGMLLPTLEADADVTTIAGEIVTTLAAPAVVDSFTLQVTVSVGVSVFPAHGRNYAQLLRHADLAMLDAKATRRNTYRVFDHPLAEVARARVTLVDELRVAVAERQFELLFQPQVSLLDAELIGFEVLVRWRHPQRGLIAPDVFIGIAEELGLIGILGQFVADNAIRQASEWRRRIGRPFSLALNLSAHQLRDGLFAEQLREILARYAFAAEDVELEITESAFVEAIDAAPRQLQALHDLGVRIVLDDLGVAYSAFSYLKRFQVHGVKLDRGFVHGIPGNAIDSAIARAIIALARTLKLRLVAEGVELPEQREYLIDQGCEEAQGYLFARPMTIAEVDAMLAAPQSGTGHRLLLLPRR